MRWRDKYIVGMTVMSMFFTLPLVSAEEEVVVYGDEFDNGDETAATDESVPINENSTVTEAPVETPEEQITVPEDTITIEDTTDTEGTTESENTNVGENTTYGGEETQSDVPEETPVEEVNPTEEQTYVEEVNPTEEQTPVEEVNPIVEEEDTSHHEGTIDNSSDNSGYVGDDTDDGSYGDAGNSDTYGETYPVETPIEESQTDPENEPSGTETPIYNPPVEENTVYTEDENLGESTETTLNTGDENENTTIGLDDGTAGIYTDGFSSGEDGSTNVRTPVTNGDVTSPPTGETTTKSKKTKTEKEKKLKTQKARFVKLLSDDTYEYYLDRSAVRWVSMPYSTSEYMADVWIRMIEKNPTQSEDMPNDMYQYLNSGGNEISDAAEKGLAYNEVDEKVLRSRKYFLEHYYIRPKTRQIQFLCELEVIGRPQNAVSERPYDYKNWENLIPGSVESYIYSGTLAEIGTGKSKKRNHMTFVDMLDEYARIALN